MPHVTQQLSAHFIRVMQRGPAERARKRSMDQSVTQGRVRMRIPLKAKQSPYSFQVIVCPNVNGKLCASMMIVFVPIQFKPIYIKKKCVIVYSYLGVVSPY